MGASRCFISKISMRCFIYKMFYLYLFQFLLVFILFSKCSISVRILAVGLFPILAHVFVFNTQFPAYYCF